MTPQEKKTEAIRLRGEGLKIREICERLDARRSTVGQWVADPDGVKLRVRHDRARGTCERCGSRTGWCSTSGGYRFCKDCAPDAYRLWTRESVVEAIQLFAQRYGHKPSATDFNPGQARGLGHERRAKRYEDDGDYPSSQSVRKVFGKWNTAIAAAGFEPNGAGQYDRSRSLKEAA